MEPDIGSESRFLPTAPPLHSTPPLGGGGSRRNITIPFATEKLEWLGYPAVKKLGRYVYSFWHNLRRWQTDSHTQTDTAWRLRPRSPRLHSIARQKPAKTLKCLCRPTVCLASEFRHRNKRCQWLVSCNVVWHVTGSEVLFLVVSVCLFVCLLLRYNVCNCCIVTWKL